MWKLGERPLVARRSPLTGFRLGEPFHACNELLLLSFFISVEEKLIEPLGTEIGVTPHSRPTNSLNFGSKVELVCLGATPLASADGQRPSLGLRLMALKGARHVRIAWGV
jgi:hypothetical protein